MIDKSNKGKQFTHVYGSKGDPQSDSNAARRRLATLCHLFFPHHNDSPQDRFLSVVIFIELRTGISFPKLLFNGNSENCWKDFFETVEVEKMLDCITLISNHITDSEASYKDTFLKEAQLIFQDENLAYTIDDAGGVHPLIDAAFSADYASVIATLSDDRYKATRKSLEKIDPALLQEEPDYIGAIRAVFAANENLFKLMYSKQSLTAASTTKTIQPLLDSLYEKNNIQKQVSAKQVEAYKKWIDAAHFYRHEQGTKEPSQPSEDLAILMISQGLSFVRWLAGIDREMPNYI